MSAPKVLSLLHTSSLFSPVRPQTALLYYLQNGNNALSINNC
jgi:hypothetical protein